MPRDTAAVRALKAALAEATTPTEQADIASKLARAQHQQGIERGRKRRAKAAKPKPPAPPVDDSNEIFAFDFAYPPQQPPPTPQPRVERLTAEQIAELNTIHQPPPMEPEPEIDLANDDLPPNAWRPDGTGGWTRTIAAAAIPGARWYDAVRGVWEEDLDPHSSVGLNDWYPAATYGATSYVFHADTHEFDFEREERLRREEESHLSELRSKLWGR